MIAELSSECLASRGVGAGYVGEAVLGNGVRCGLRVPFRVLHYYYPLSLIRDEVYRRTSLLGKHRRDKDGATLLDDLVLSVDDDVSFMRLCRAASEAVLGKLMPYTRRGVRCYFFDDALLSVSDLTGVYHPRMGVVKVNGKRLVYECVLASEIHEEEECELVAHVSGVYTTELPLAGGGKRYHDEEFECDVLERFPHHSDRLNGILSVPIKPLGSGERFVEVTESKVRFSASLRRVSPGFIRSGMFVNYRDAKGVERRLYVLRDCDEESVMADGAAMVCSKDFPDMCHSVHYVLFKPEWVHEESVVLSDRSIFEALCAYIVWKWCECVLPSEASYFYDQWMDRLTDVKYNLGFNGCMSVNSHPF